MPRDIDLIRVEHYDREMHGYEDDCDFVVIADKSADQDLAERVAAGVSYTGEYHRHEDDHVIKYFCVHA